MNLHEAYYLFQHRLIPQAFFGDKVDFVNTLAAGNKKMLFTWMDTFFDRAGVENPYSEDMFDVEIMQYDKTVYIIKITFPHPEEVPSCYCSYLLFDLTCKRQMYFCVEKGEKDDFLCGWDAKNDHLNYGKCDRKSGDTLKRCLHIYLR